MKPEQLIGKLAIRTQPPKGLDDYSYTTETIRIIKVTENHIVYDHVGTLEEKIFEDKKYILDKRWIDDNWEDYNELIGNNEIKTIFIIDGKNYMED